MIQPVAGSRPTNRSPIRTGWKPGSNTTSRSSSDSDLLILPAWMESPDPERIAIKIDPGMAFGTGTHPTTQLCLELMESVFDTQTVDGGPLTESVHRPPSTVIDVGCGSGILSIAAIKLGRGESTGRGH
ncbi:MAG: 50S ribosomal protein L11 methyltransferase [Ignavibacteriales bacterium]|nr:50S ribosomal protein L11 methyltransferase [Ignavibacteriales bacterium]